MPQRVSQEEIAAHVKELSDASSDVRAKAVRILSGLASESTESRAAIVYAGAIKALMGLTPDATTSVREKVVLILKELAAKDSEVRKKIVESGVSELLCGWLCDDSAELRGHAIELARVLALYSGNPITLDFKEVGHQLVALLGDADIGVKKAALKTLQDLAFANDSNRVAIARAEAIVPLMTLMGDDRLGIRRGALGTLRCLSYSAENRVAIFNRGAIVPLISLLEDADAHVRKYAVCILDSLALHDQCKAAISSAGAILPLSALLRDRNFLTKEKSAAVLMKLATASEHHATIISTGAVASLLKLLNDSRVSVRTSPLLSYIRRVKLKMRTSALGALVNLAVNADSQRAILSAGGISTLRSILVESDNDTVLRENATLLLSQLESIAGSDVPAPTDDVSVLPSPAPEPILERDRTSVMPSPDVDETSSGDVFDGVGKIPDAYICPITRELMEEPVITADGHTYDRAAITAWFSRGNHTSPLTNLPLRHRELTPNHALKASIDEFQKSMPCYTRYSNLKLILDTLEQDIAEGSTKKHLLRAQLEQAQHNAVVSLSVPVPTAPPLPGQLDSARLGNGGGQRTATVFSAPAPSAPPLPGQIESADSSEDVDKRSRPVGRYYSATVYGNDSRRGSIYAHQL